jgi:hypothetical protein
VRSKPAPTVANCCSSKQRCIALRGAAHGLMAAVPESHLRERFGAGADHAVPAVDPRTEIDHLVVPVRCSTR